MQYAKLDMLNELTHLAHCRRTHVPAALIADWALAYVKAEIRTPAQDNDVQFLERLYALPDRRA
jgi:hypothetical protein